MSVEKDDSLPELNRHTMIQYLLGELPPAWQEHFEEQFFTDKESFEQLKLVEDQLVDDYVSEVLPGEQKKRFESHYLNSDRRRQKLKFAQTLKQTLREFSEAHKDASRLSLWHSVVTVWRTSVLRYSFAALTIAAIMGGSWLAIEGLRLKRQRQQLEAERVLLRQQAAQATENDDLPERSTAQSSATPSITPRPSPSLLQEGERQRAFDSTVLTVILYAGTDRDEAARGENIPLSPPIKSLKLKLKLMHKESYTKYRAVLETTSAQPLITHENLSQVTTPQGGFVTLQIPAYRLPANDYILTLAGKNPGQDYEEIADYQFRILKR